MQSLFDSLGGNSALVFEWALLVFILLVAALWPELGRRSWERLEGELAAVSDSPWRSTATVMLIAILLRLVFLPFVGFHSPDGGDQAAITLQAETYLRGRLSNPVHPLYEFFETVYAQQGPGGYSGMYFPGRAFAPALGLAIAGEGGVGIWISMVVISGALVWALRGWVPPALAFLGGAIFAVKFAFSTWMLSLYSLELATLGGALVLGAYPRLLKSVRLRDATLMGVGVFILVTARPYEGLLFSLPFAGVLAWRLLTLLRGGAFASALRMSAPVICFVVAGVALVVANNVANTGDPLLTPYAMNRTDYAGTPAFLFEEAKPATREVAEPIRRFYAREGEGYHKYHGPNGLAISSLAKIKNSLSFYIGPLLFLPFVAGIPWLVRRPELLVSLGLVGAGIMVLQFNWSHYIGPAAPLLLLVVLAGFDRLRRWAPRGRPVGLFLSRALPAALAAILLVPAASLTLDWPPTRNAVNSACCFLNPQDDRTEVERVLAGLPDDDLVFVRYHPRDSGWKQWVHNGPEIDRQRIVWAHDLGAAKNEQLIAYYPKRRVWLVDGLMPWTLRPYNGNGTVYRKAPPAR